MTSREMEKTAIDYDIEAFNIGNIDLEGRSVSIRSIAQQKD